VLWPQDTFVGFHRLGFGIILSWVAVLVIHGNFSYPTVSGWLPDPFFRVFLKNIHKDKHGSDTGTYDTEGRFIPQRFEDIFSKYADGRDYLTIWDVSNVLKGQRCIADPIGWGGAFFECERSRRTCAEYSWLTDMPRACYIPHALARRWPHDEGRYSWDLRREHLLHSRSKEIEELVGLDAAPDTHLTQWYKQIVSIIEVHIPMDSTCTSVFPRILRQGIDSTIVFDERWRS
jgi:hypothetical protein